MDTPFPPALDSAIEEAYTTLEQEYGLLAAEFGYDRADLARIARNAFEVSGLNPERKLALLEEYDRWVAEAFSIPEIQE